MASYIGKVQIGADESLIGSTLYGICNTPANETQKKIDASQLPASVTAGYVNTDYNNPIRGSTIHIKFTQGNTVSTGVSLLVGTLVNPIDVIGEFICPENTVISFTLDENQKWVVNDISKDTTYTFGEGSSNGTISVTPAGGTAQSISVHGLGNSAYTNVITDIANHNTSTDLPTTAAVVTYVQDMTGGLSGLSGAMHFRGSVTANGVTITDGGTEMPHIEGYDYQDGNPKSNFTPEPGDVVLFEQKEFVWSNSAWELLGDESSYALKSSTDTITEVGVFTANTLPSLTVTDTTVSSVSVTNGSAASLTTNNVTIPKVNRTTTASVSAGILNITLGEIDATPITVKEVNVFTANTPTAVTATPVTVGSASGWSAGSQASLSTNNTTVVVPNTPTPVQNENP